MIFHCPIGPQYTHINPLCVQFDSSPHIEMQSFNLLDDIMKKKKKRYVEWSSHPIKTASGPETSWKCLRQKLEKRKCDEFKTPRTTLRLFWGLRIGLHVSELWKKIEKAAKVAVPETPLLMLSPAAAATSDLKSETDTWLQLKFYQKLQFDLSQTFSVVLVISASQTNCDRPAIRTAASFKVQVKVS